MMKKIGLVILALWAFMSYAENTKEAQLQLARQYVIALQNKDFSTVNRLFDYDATAQIVLEKLSTQDRQKIKLRTIKHFKNAHKSFSDSSDIRLMGERAVSGFSGLMVRLVDQNYLSTYLGLQFEKMNNQWVIVDYFDFTTQQNITQNIIDAFDNAMATVDNNMYAKEHGKSEKEKMQAFNQFLREGSYDEAKKIYKTLSEDLRSSELLLQMTLKLAQRNKDETFYNELLAVVNKYHADTPIFYQYLSDYYLEKQNYAKARKHLAKLVNAVGADGAITIQEVGISLAEGDYPRALKESRECAERESDFRPCYQIWTGIALRLKNYTELIKAYDTQSKNLGDVFTKSFFNKEIYGNFVHSEAFKNWDIPEE